MEKHKLLLHSIHTRSVWFSHISQLFHLSLKQALVPFNILTSMQAIKTNDEGSVYRLKNRTEFAMQALPAEQMGIFQDLKCCEDAYEQEILWGQWVEGFFDKGKITWEAFAAVPLMQTLSLKANWFDLRPLWEYLLFMAHHVERIYFYYDRQPGPSFSSEELRWKDVQRREETRPWLRLAFHAFREYAFILEERLDAAPKPEKELIYKLLWVILSFGKVELQARTQLKLRDWACTFQREQNRMGQPTDQQQLGLFRTA